MKITFVLPAIGKKKGERYIKTWKMEPLAISTLKALVPKDWEVSFYDDRLKHIRQEGLMSYTRWVSSLVDTE